MSWSPEQIFETETRRFRLRSMTEADVSDDYVAWWNDPELQAGFGTGPRGWGYPAVCQNLKNFDNKTAFHLGVYQKKDEGLVGFLTLNVDYLHNVSTANFLLGDRSLWGTGVLVEIKVHLMEFLFNTLGCEKLETKIFGRNLPSIYSSKAMGFTPEGVLRSYKEGPDGKRLDVYLFGLTKEEWEALKAKGEGPYK